MSFNNINVSSSITGASVSCTSANDRIIGGAGDDTIEALQGADRVQGGDGNDVIDTDSSGLGSNGVSGRDFVKAGAGDDEVEAGVSKDKIYGEEGNDSLSGENGDDRLYGGSGADTLNGGNGDDVIYVGEVSTRGVGDGSADVVEFDSLDGKDKVYGFWQADGDTIMLLDGDDIDVDIVHTKHGDTRLTYGDTSVIFYDVLISESDLVFV